MSDKDKFIIGICCTGEKENLQFKKYSYIRNNDVAIGKFKRFAEKKYKLHHINFYNMAGKFLNQYKNQNNEQTKTK